MTGVIDSFTVRSTWNNSHFDFVGKKFNRNSRGITAIWDTSCFSLTTSVEGDRFLVVVVEALNVALVEAIDNNLFYGIKVGKDKIHISHLKFADDALILGEWSILNAKNLSRILTCFHLASALKVNFNKSKLFGIGVFSEELYSMAFVIGCLATQFPCTYLGLLIGAKMSRCRNWEPLINRFQKRLSKWKANSLSFGSRLTLIKSVLGSMVVYYFSTFKALKKIIHKLAVGFSSKWRKWINFCLDSAYASILINGSPTKEFKLERGLRQGDPLSPFVFILAVEAFNVALVEAIDNNLFYGVSSEELYSMAFVIGCLASQFPCTYLGLPIGAKMSRCRNWEPLINRFQNRLSKWKANSLSFGSRLTFIKFVLGSMVVYYFSTFKAPKKIIHKLAGIWRRFF
nr:RNA-directed DNA polymerase, eukaryota, reverse transcriptase zinc-binding domain protein [Tanacetum cinerariifolium]